MRILAYSGVSALSRTIRLLTRSRYSHISVELDNGNCVEAWSTSGVIERVNFREGHKPGTEVDVFRINGNLDSYRAERFLREQIGKKYDWLNVFRFLYHKRSPETPDRRWFCSELAEYALSEGFVTLLNGNKSEHSPRDTVMSPLLEFETTRIV